MAKVKKDLTIHERLELIQVTEVNGKLVTTSNNVAEVFGKDHFNVLRIIKATLQTWKELSLDEIGAINFDCSSHIIESQYVSEQNKTQPNYLLSEFAFNRIVLKFTGKESEAFAILFINKFVEMRKTLSEARELLVQLNNETNKALQDQIKYLVDKTKALEEASSYFRIRDYFNGQGINLAREDCMMLGAMATKYCKANRIIYKKEYSDNMKFNIYPIKVLELTLKQYQSSIYSKLFLFDQS